MCTERTRGLAIIINPLYFNGCMILKKKFYRHLGLTLDSKLAFTEHINDKIKIANRFIGVLKYLSKYLPLKTLDQVYKMFIRPHLDYGDVVFHIPHTQSLLTLLSHYIP